MTNGRGRQGMSGAAVALAAMLLLAGCITAYTGYPRAVAVPGQAPGVRAAAYTIKKFDVLNAGGEQAIEETLRQSPVFADAQRLYEGDPVPEKGVVVDIDPAYTAPSLPAVIFGYLSVSTLTILPAYSGKDGYSVGYRVSVDGEPAKTYRYTVRRKVGLWLPLLAFIWVNLMTSSEEDAFHATTSRFLADAHADGLI